jgi:tetratricopeptide (TPR) repeat protein
VRIFDTPLGEKLAGLDKVTPEEAGSEAAARDIAPRRNREVATGVPERARAADLLNEGQHAEQLGALERAISAFTAASLCDEPEIAAEAFTRLADAHRSRAEWEEATTAAQRGQQAARAAGAELLLAHAMIAEGNVLICKGAFNEAKELFDRVLVLTSDAQMRGLALQNIGSILAQQGQLGAAERVFAESYGCFQRAGYRRGEAIALNNYGRAALDRDNLSLAEDLLTQALGTAREVEHAELIALATLNLAEAKARRGQYHDAEDLASQALGFFASCGNRWREIECLRLIGAINEQSGDRVNAGRCYARGLQIAQAVGASAEERALHDCLCRLQQRR